MKQIYQKLAEKHNDVEDKILGMIRPGVKVIDLCMFIESELGKDIAFPVGINIDHCAAHYSPLDINDSTEFKKEDVIKIDYGIQKDGIILDAAFTVAFDPIHRDLLEASRKACMEGAKHFTHRRPIIEVTHQIVKQIPEKFGMIKDLCGHQISPYKIHGGKVVPNVVIPYKERALEGEIYTVEPFVSTSKVPDVYNSTDICEHSHFMYNYFQNSFVSSKSYLQLLPTLYNYNTLAFNIRWLPDAEKVSLKKLTDKNLYHSYPPIYEKDTSAKIAQFETTLLVTKGFPILFKTYDSVDKYIIN